MQQSKLNLFEIKTLLKVIYQFKNLAKNYLKGKTFKIKLLVNSLEQQKNSYEIVKMMNEHILKTRSRRWEEWDVLSEFQIVIRKKTVRSMNS